MCLSVWAGGLVIHAIREFPTLHGLSVLTGVIWTFGNMLSVVIIKFIGVGLGAVYWNTTGLNFKYIYDIIRGLNRSFIK